MDKQEIDWGGSVFPHEYELCAGEKSFDGEVYAEDRYVVHHGANMRTYIAIRAMHALISYVEKWSEEEDDFAGPKWAADRAVQYADALIKRLGEDDVSE